MIELNNQIKRLEMRSEQLRIHLRSLKRMSPEAGAARSALFAMLKNLVVLKGRRERLESELGVSA